MAASSGWYPGLSPTAADGRPTVPIWMGGVGIGQLQILSLYAVDGAKELCPFIVGKSMKDLVGEIENTTTESNGVKYVLRVRDPVQVRKLLGMKTLFDGTEVKVEQHPVLNKRRCVIFCREIKNKSEEELLEKMSENGVVGVKRITRMQEGKPVNTSAVILTVNGTAVPEHIKVGPLRVETRIYVPDTMICYRCFDYGHTKFRCKNAPRCRNCSHNHESEVECQAAPYCLHCGGGHGPASRSCPVYKREKEITRLRFTKGITHQEAEKQFNAGGGSYAAVSKVQHRLEAARATSAESEQLKAKDETIKQVMDTIAKLTSRIEELEKQHRTKKDKKRSKRIQIEQDDGSVSEMETDSSVKQTATGTTSGGTSSRRLGMNDTRVKIPLQNQIPNRTEQSVSLQQSGRVGRRTLPSTTTMTSATTTTSTTTTALFAAPSTTTTTMKRATTTRSRRHATDEDADAEKTEEKTPSRAMLDLIYNHLKRQNDDDREQNHGLSRGRKRRVTTYKRMFRDPRGSTFIRGPAFTGVDLHFTGEYSSFEWSKVYIGKLRNPRYAHLILPFDQTSLVTEPNMNVFLDDNKENRTQYVPHEPSRFQKTCRYDSQLFEMPKTTDESSQPSSSSHFLKKRENSCFESPSCSSSAPFPEKATTPTKGENDTTTTGSAKPGETKDDVNFECCFARPVGTAHNFYAIDDEKHTYQSYRDQLASKVRTGGSRVILWYRVDWTQLEVDQRIAFLLFCDHLLSCSCRQIHYHVCPDRDEPDDTPDYDFTGVGRRTGAAAEEADDKGAIIINDDDDDAMKDDEKNSDLYGTIVSNLDTVPLHPAQSRYIYFASRRNPRDECTCPPDDTRVNSFTVTGPPGCGKTHLVKFISSFNPRPVLPSNVAAPTLTYLAPTNALTRATAAATTQTIKCQTICQYIMQMFGINFFEYLEVQSILNKTGLYVLFKHIFQKYRYFMAQNEFRHSKQYADQRQFPPEAYDDPEWRRTRRTHSPPSSDDWFGDDGPGEQSVCKVIFIDEITMSAPQLLCVIRMMTAVLLPFNSRLIIVWLGDPDQLLPIYANTLQYDAIQLALDRDTSLRYLSEVPQTQEDEELDEAADWEVQLCRGQNVRLLICKRTRDRQFVRFISLCRRMLNEDDVIKAVVSFLDELKIKLPASITSSSINNRLPPRDVDDGVGRINTPLSYRYPIETIIETCVQRGVILKALDEYFEVPVNIELIGSEIKDQLNDLINIILENRFHETILTDVVVTYRNRDVHYCDLSLANVVANQIEKFLSSRKQDSDDPGKTTKGDGKTTETKVNDDDASKDTDHDSKTRRDDTDNAAAADDDGDDIQTLNHYIMYHVVGLESEHTVEYKTGNYILHMVPSSELDIPVVPLIRFMPYVYIGTQQRNLRGLRLILLAGTKRQLYFLAHEPGNRFTVQRVLMEHFNLKVIKNKTSLEFGGYGFPVKLAFGHTFHSSQGLTLTQYVTIVMHEISLRALYVAITRAKEFKQICRFIVPDSTLKDISARLQKRNRLVKVHRSDCRAGGGGASTNGAGAIVDKPDDGYVWAERLRKQRRRRHDPYATDIQPKRMRHNPTSNDTTAQAKDMPNID